jgi:hypothetical protein
MNFLLAIAFSASGVKLTLENYHEKTDDKVVFIKFLAPW